MIDWIQIKFTWQQRLLLWYYFRENFERFLTLYRSFRFHGRRSEITEILVGYFNILNLKYQTKTFLSFGEIPNTKCVSAGWTCEWWMCNMLWWTLWICVSLFICWLILHIIFIVYKVLAFELKRLNTKDASTSTISIQ